MKTANFLIVGVGGQGTILASDVVAEVGLRLGCDVKKSEIHGMSQRGGSVESHVRWADKVYSPLCARGEVNYLVALESLEAARWADYVAPNGLAVINTQRVAPLVVSSGQARYPTDREIRGIYLQRTERIHFVDGLGIARRLGNQAVASVVLLGYLSAFLDVDRADWEEVVRRRVPARFVQLNIEALEAGRSLAEAPKVI
ncbi:MAG: indolepyruvate oxidoreductase subunit beta [Chloroflexi bacterium]|nr:indolepyruvate oxidoreductase subunit beta [Chloroflexota bacterium]